MRPLQWRFLSLSCLLSSEFWGGVVTRVANLAMYMYQPIAVICTRDLSVQGTDY